jgi:CheY-like chemotaxis protein
VVSPADEQYFEQVYGDRSRLVQVIVNFLSNSIKFSNRDSKIIISLQVIQKQVLKSQSFNDFKNDFDSTPKSRSSLVSNFGGLAEQVREELVEEMSLESDTAYIYFKLDIQDYGAGIPKDKINKLFINFGNLTEHQKINQSGRGLGLSICKLIVEQMGGSVKVSSEQNVGSVFSIRMKAMCRLGAKLEEIVFSNSRHSIGADDIQRDLNLMSSVDSSHLLRVLFVNDDPFLLFTYSEQLKTDFVVEQAENGMQALQMVSSKPSDYYDVIVLDINMPIMDGFEACVRISNFFKESALKMRDPSTCNVLFNQSQKFKVSPLSGKAEYKKQRSLQEIKNQEEMKAERKDSRVFIIALTADESPEMAAEIAAYPFDMQCAKLTADMVNVLVNKELEIISLNDFKS